MKSKNKMNIKTFWQPGLVLIIMMVGLSLSFHEQSQLTDSVQHTWKVKSTLEKILNSIKNAETGQRGYILTRETLYLEPYHKGITDYKELYTEVKTLIRNNPRQLKRIKETDSLVNLKMAELQKTIDLTEKNKSSQTLTIVKSDSGKLLMEQIVDNLNIMQVEEERLLEKAQNKYLNWRNATYLFILVTAFLFIYLLIRLYNYVIPFFEELESARKALHNSNANMSETIAVLKLEFEEKELLLRERELELEALKTRLSDIDDDFDQIENAND